MSAHLNRIPVLADRLWAKARGGRIAWACVLIGHRYRYSNAEQQYVCERPGCTARVLPTDTTKDNA